MGQPHLGRFGDARLQCVGGALLAAMLKKRTMCVHALAKGRSQSRQFQRFLDNDAVSIREMLVHAGRLTGARVSGRHVLAISDMSEMNFAAHAGRKRGFGTVGNGTDIGVFLHPVIAVDADQGGLIGLVGAEVMNRTGGKVTDHKQRGADDKESRRWLAGAETAGTMLADAAMITVVEDREGDIYDQFARRPPSVHLLVRAAQDRTLATKQPLFAHCAAWLEQARYPVVVPPQAGQSGRTAMVALRFGEVVLKRPDVAGTALPATLTLRVVDVAEIDPANPKERVHWCLLTTHTVQTQEDARRIVGWYQMRWIIEQVFRTLKSAGVEVESSQITRPANLLKLTVVALIAAVRVMQLVLARDGSTGQSLSDAAEPADVPALQAINATLEGRTEKLKNPFDVTSLAWLAWIAARLGGWSGYTSRGYRPAGPKTIARGLKLLDPMVAAWKLANRSALLGLP
ncbi:MAG TPA: IS4 family transposase [Acetobacteraceae bacterium]|jgi:hypothetical protein